ncbi:hypothetical protein G6M16_007600 [Agrobacterium tumefaciens]|nr:hypothetical protein G6M16_007600 [Agrobacterium tumefaciens]
MTDLKTFARRVATAASRADHLREAIKWMEPKSREDVLTDPTVYVSQPNGNAATGYPQAMDLISTEMKSMAEAVAQSTLEKAKKELAEIEDMFARFTEQENAP